MPRGSIGLPSSWPERARTALEEGLQVAYDLPFRRARVLHELGVMHAARGEREDASTRFAEALAIFQELGGRPYARRTEQALERLTSVGRDGEVHGRQ